MPLGADFGKLLVPNLVDRSYVLTNTSITGKILWVKAQTRYHCIECRIMPHHSPRKRAVLSAPWPGVY